MRLFASLLSLFCFGAAQAVTVVPEPPTPSVLGSSAVCNKSANKNIAIRQYLVLQDANGKPTRIFTNTTSVNGQKIFQREERGVGSAQKIILYVRDAQVKEGSVWLKYEVGKDDDPTERHKRYLQALGLTEEEYKALGLCFTRSLRSPK